MFVPVPSRRTEGRLRRKAPQKLRLLSRRPRPPEEKRGFQLRNFLFPLVSIGHVSLLSIDEVPFVSIGTLRVGGAGGGSNAEAMQPRLHGTDNDGKLTVNGQ